MAAIENELKKQKNVIFVGTCERYASKVGWKTMPKRRDAQQKFVDRLVVANKAVDEIDSLGEQAKNHIKRINRVEDKQLLFAQKAMELTFSENVAREKVMKQFGVSKTRAMKIVKTVRQLLALEASVAEADKERWRNDMRLKARAFYERAVEKDDMRNQLNAMKFLADLDGLKRGPDPRLVKHEIYKVKDEEDRGDMIDAEIVEARELLLAEGDGEK